MNIFCWKTFHSIKKSKTIKFIWCQLERHKQHENQKNLLIKTRTGFQCWLRFFTVQTKPSKLYSRRLIHRFLLTFAWLYIARNVERHLFACVNNAQVNFHLPINRGYITITGMRHVEYKAHSYDEHDDFIMCIILDMTRHKVLIVTMGLLSGKRGDLLLIYHCVTPWF